MKKILKSGILALLTLALTAQGAWVFASSPERAPAAKNQKAGKAAAGSLSIGTKGNELAFDKAKLTAKKGQKVKLVFTNSADKTSGIQHNWVLVKPGTADDVANASVAAGAAKNWVAESSNIIVHTKLLNPGESETIEFTAPAQAGDYPFICTFPGHATTMRGVLTVQ